jgi:hypothetical protein
MTNIHITNGLRYTKLEIITIGNHMTDNIPFWRPYIAQAEKLCKDDGGFLSWETKYEDLSFIPMGVKSKEVVDAVWELEDAANRIDPKTGYRRERENYYDI